MFVLYTLLIVGGILVFGDPGRSYGRDAAGAFDGGSFSIVRRFGPLVTRWLRRWPCLTG